ncbi:uncharacterized protein [Montipora capricornis]
METLSHEVSIKVWESSSQHKEILDVTLLGSEWNSSSGGLSTLNRELAIHLAQHPIVRVSLLVPEGVCNDRDKKEARSFGINVLDARKRTGYDPLDWLCFPPEGHKMDVVVGHGVKLGKQVQFIKSHFENCTWVHVVHTAPEDLSKYKGYANPTSRGEQKHWDEVDLCKCADLVVPVGPRLEKAYSSYLQGCKKSEDIFEMVPGLFNREFGDLVQNDKSDSDNFKVLLCGRGDEEDFELKGYNIAVKAFTDHRLKGRSYDLLFVGAPDGKQDKVRERLLNFGIVEDQLTVRKFVHSRVGMKHLLCEVDLVIMPSKTEGFGLVALEALSAGLPVLVGSNSGFARAIKCIPLGAYSIVDSEDPVKWAEAIEGVRNRHKMCLEEIKLLREFYGQKYCWKEQCEALLDKLRKMVHENFTSQAAAANGLVEQQPESERLDTGLHLEILGVHGNQTDLTVMQQYAGIKESAVISGRENAKKQELKRILEFNADAEAVPHTNAKIQEPERFILNNYWDEFLEARLRKLAVLQVEPQMQDLKIKKNLTDQEQQTEPVSFRCENDAAILEKKENFTQTIPVLKNALTEKEEEIRILQQQLQLIQMQSYTQEPTASKSDKISLKNFQSGDTILLVFDDTYKSYLVVTTGPTLFFLHPDSLDQLDLAMSGPKQRPWVLAKFTHKEYCCAKKARNRFLVPIGTKFYRVHAKPCELKYLKT